MYRHALTDLERWLLSLPLYLVVGEVRRLCGELLAGATR